MHYMWADTLENAERIFLLRLLVWALGSVLAGTALIAWLKATGRASRLLTHFGAQCVAWGLVELALALAFLARLAPRDLASATRLDRLLWLSVGLDGGYVIAGTCLAVSGWRLGRRLGLVGAGLAVIVQGLGLALLDLALAAQISR